MWSHMGPHVQWNLSNVVAYGTSCTVEPVSCGCLWDPMYSGTCLMWSPMGPHVQWNLSNVVTYGTSCTVKPVYSVSFYYKPFYSINSTSLRILKAITPR